MSKLSIKEGVKLQPFGGSTIPFTSESNLSQDVLEYLQKKYPNDITQEKPQKPTTNKK